jgi:predicted SAM-dependent methyltransferase
MFKIFRKKFECPICSYIGPFTTLRPETGIRKYAQCPSCNSLERHRLQYLVFEKIYHEKNLSDINMLHFAPEAFMETFFSNRANDYFKVDLNMDAVDCKADMCSLPFPSSSFNFVYASHVLEHIKLDYQALNEVERVLAPGGIIFLPVPIVSTSTIEYSEPNPYESNHVRAPGLDYFDRYKKCFSHVDVYSSASFDEKYQLYLYEDRSKYPSEKFPYRDAMEGVRHSDYVPVCFS